MVKYHIYKKSTKKTVPIADVLLREEQLINKLLIEWLKEVDYIHFFSLD